MNPCNALVTSWSIKESDRYSKSLEISLNLELQDGGGCVFSVAGVYVEEWGKNQFAYALKRIMDICGVDSVCGISGSAIRAKFLKDGNISDIIIGIGHFLKDDWFIPREEKLWDKLPNL